MLTYRGSPSKTLNPNDHTSSNDEKDKNDKNKSPHYYKHYMKQKYQKNIKILIISLILVLLIFKLLISTRGDSLKSRTSSSNALDLKTRNIISNISPHHKRIVFLKPKSKTSYFNRNPRHETIKKEINDENEEEVEDYDESIIPVNTSSCVPMRSWQVISKPSCNILHEIDMSVEIDGRLGSGGWRIAWKLGDVVLKTAKLKSSSFGKVAMSRHFTDAIISSRLSSSNSVINIYGHCAQTVLNELAISNLRSLIKKHNHENTKTSFVICKYALDIAHALADIHTIDGDNNATIVYKDLKPDNIVLSREGVLKLSDFNDSELLKWNVTSRKQCYFRRRRWKANFHSPEEVWEDGLTHKLDIYALGGILYYILVGYNPYNKIPDSEVMRSVADGKLPEIPQEIRNENDPIVVGIMKLMKECYRYNPDDRPDARYVENEIRLLLNHAEN